MRCAPLATLVLVIALVGCGVEGGAEPAAGVTPADAADELAARFPDTVGGEPLELTTYVGDEIDFELGLPTDPEVLEALGVDRSALVYVTSAPPTIGGEDELWVSAFRFVGADEADVVVHFLGAWEAQYPEQAERVTVGGKEVIRIPGASLYLDGDTVYSLGGDDEMMAELLAALP